MLGKKPLVCSIVFKKRNRDKGRKSQRKDYNSTNTGFLLYNARGTKY